MNRLAIYEFLRRAASVIAPNFCPFCGRVIAPEEYYCEECFKLLPKIREQPFPPENLRRLYAYCWYTGIARDAVHMLKFGKCYIYPADAFGLLMSEMLTAENACADALVPVPSSVKSIDIRGFAPAAVIAERISIRMNIPVENAIDADFDKIEQKTLTRKSRAINARRCFHISKYADVAGKKLILIDDVTTTGSTLSALAEMLLNAGASEVSAAVFAKVPGEFKKSSAPKLYRKTERKKCLEFLRKM